ncbi:MAG: EAL domain-containing protein [Candidatus Thiodiazotropha sp. (ex Lucinoma borealis)]|nr:EAL domain-containing protein [Candidatus Thiodiazotropha sp. (ex Lucinoma borealis)]
MNIQVSLTLLVLVLFVALSLTLLLRAKQKKQYQNLVNRERYLQTIIEARQEGIWLVDAQGITLSVNQRTAEILGFRIDEFQTNSIYEILSKKAGCEIKSKLQQAYSNVSEVDDFEFQFENSGLVWIRMSFKSIKDDQSVIYGVLITLNDITVAHQEQLAIKENQEDFRQLTESIREVFWLGSPDWKQVFYVSPAYELIWGRSRQSLYDNPTSWSEVIHESDREIVNSFISESVNNEWETLNFPEFRINRPDDEQRWIEARAYAIRDDEGALYRVAGIAEDITERKQIELALQSSEEYLRQIMDSAAEAIYTLDASGNCTSINHTGLSLLGYENADQLIGRNMHDLIHYRYSDGSSYAAEDCPIFKAFLDNQKIHIEDEVLWRKDGSYFPVEYWSYPLNIKDLTIGAVVTFIDITERKFNQQLLASRLRLHDYAQDHTMHDLLVYTLDEACETTGSQVGFYHFLEADQNTVSLQAWSTHTTQDYCHAEASGMHYNLDQAGVWADAVRQRRPIIHNDYPALLNKQGLPDGHAEVIRELVVPVFRGEKIVAIMGVGNKPLLTYDERDVDKVAGLADLAWEIVEQKLIEERLEQSEKQLSTILDTVTEGVALWDEQGQLRYINHGFNALFGQLDDRRGEADFKGQTLASLMSDKVPAEADILPLKQLLEEGGPAQSRVLQISGQQGDKRWVKFNIQPLFDITKQHVTGIVSSATDVTVQQTHEDQLRQQAHYDALTQLPNRLLATDRLKQLMAHVKRAGNLLAVGYLDLDGFKEINDKYGHDAGDAVLKETARRLSINSRDGDTVARLGGDEFLVLLADLTDQFESLLILKRILHEMAAPYEIAGSTASVVTASLGVTFYPNDNSDSKTLIRHADQAMYLAKRSGKNNFKFYSQDYESRILAQQQTEKEIGLALERSQLVIYYQPIVNCRKRTLVGVEGLIRWNHPILGLLEPAEFLPLIHTDSLMFAISEWVIHEALMQMKSWFKEGMPLSISINLFSREITDSAFLGMLRSKLAEHGYDPAYPLVLEISESSTQGDSEELYQFVKQCMELGVICALDDCGGEIASITNLQKISVKRVSIDSSITQHVQDDKSKHALAEAIVGVVNAFGITAVAEGVETKSQMESLLSMGCECMQGYYIARPMDTLTLSGWSKNMDHSITW